MIFKVLSNRDDSVIPMCGSCGAAVEPRLSAILFALVLQQGKFMRKMKLFPVYEKSG